MRSIVQAGVAPVARGHVIGNGRVFPVAAGPQVDGDALSFEEDLDAASSQAHVDLGAGEPVGDGVIVGVDVDVIVDADAATAPLAILVGLGGERLQRRAVDLLEQMAAGDTEPAQALPVVELRHELVERGVGRL